MGNAGKDISALAERFVQYRFHSGSGWIGRVFKEISLPDYLVMSKLAAELGIHEPGTQAYLSDISREMGLPMAVISQMVHRLQAKGYVYWEHDGHGTYIRLSETGREVMCRQEAVLRRFAGSIAERFGHSSLEYIMDLMSTLETAMEEEAEKL